MSTNNSPNIVFFMLDQLSAKWLEDSSRDAIQTPNIDRLRSMGTSFRNAFSSNPICMAARPTMATGLTTRGHGVLTNGYAMDPNLPTFMHMLQQSGWRTGAFGKVHFHPHFAGVHPDYRLYGFDVVHNTEDPRAGEWLDWVEKCYPEHYDSVLATIWPTEIPELKEYGEKGVNLSERIKELRKDFSFATEEFPKNTPGTYTLPFPEEMSQSAWITDNALEFIGEADKDKPLYAHISYVQPHGPFCPPGEYMQYVDPDKIPEPCPIEWMEDPFHPRCFGNSEGANHTMPANWRDRRHYYFADLVHLDSKLGMVLDGLEQAGRLENTYIFLLADHGELLLDHGFTGKAERHYDACIRIPMIIAGPGLRGGQVRHEFVQLEDIFPTVLAMAGLPVPEPKILGPYLKEHPEPLYGHSLLPLCKGATVREWRDSVYIESYNNIGTATPANWARTVRTAEWRYTMYPQNNGEQLFHISEDPDEQKNLCRDPRYTEIRNTLRDRLLEHVILQDYPQPPRDLFAIGVH
jgi:arylsulfatase